MKKSRLFIIAFAIALLISGALGIFASAEGEEASLKIARKNLSFENEPRLVFAVEAEGITEDISVIYYEENPLVNPSATSYTAIDLGVDKTLGLPIFALKGINPKDVSKEFYVQAISGDVKSDVFKYSVLEWVLEGTVKTDDPFFDTVLNYFSAVQDKVGYSGAHADTYKYVTVKDGTINGFPTAITAEDTVDVTYTGIATVGYAQSGWNVTENGITEAFSQNTVAVTGNAVISPILISLRDPITLGETFDGDTQSSIYKSIKSGDTISITTDPTNAANRVLQCIDATTSGTSYIGVYQTGTDYSCGSVVVFETRVYIANDPATSGYLATVGFASDKVNAHVIYLQIDETKSYAYFSGNNSYTAPSGVEKKDIPTDDPANRIPLGEWNVVRLEYHNTGTKATSTLHIYINNEYVCEYNCTGSTVISNANAGKWITYGAQRSTVYFDNMSCVEKPLD